MKSVTVSAVVGINKGYNHGNENSVTDMLKDLAREYDDIATSSEWDRYIPAVITPSITVYASGWGCPDGGEETIEISMTYNPEFTTSEDLVPGEFSDDVEYWTAVAKNNIERFARRLEQSTVFITVRENIEVDYIRL